MRTQSQKRPALESKNTVSADLTTLLKRLGAAVATDASDVSIADLSRSTQVEFPILLDEELKNFESISNVLQTVSDIFSAHLLQAIQTVANIRAIGIISKFSGANTTSLLAAGVALEDATVEHVDPNLYNLAIEADNFGSKVNLAVGKELKIKLDVGGDGDGKKTVDVTVMVRGSLLPVHSSSLHGLLAFSKKDLRFTERYHEWRAGKIRFVSDLLFMQDIVDEYKKAAIKDKHDVFTRSANQVTSDLIYSGLSGNIKINKITNVAVLSGTTRAQIEKDLNIDFDKARDREKLFAGNRVLMITVVDKTWNRVQIYTRGYADHTDLSLKDIDNYSKKGGGNDILEFLKGFNSGFSPNF